MKPISEWSDAELQAAVEGWPIDGVAPGEIDLAVEVLRLREWCQLWSDRVDREEARAEKAEVELQSVKAELAAYVNETSRT